MRGLAAEEYDLGDDISVISPFSIRILGVESNKALASSRIDTRQKMRWKQLHKLTLKWKIEVHHLRDNTKGI